MLLFVCLFLSFELVTGDGEHYLPAMNQCANWFCSEPVFSWSCLEPVCLTVQ